MESDRTELNKAESYGGSGSPVPFRQSETAGLSCVVSYTGADGCPASISREDLDRAFDARFPAWMKEKLARAHVAIAGLGGLGSNIAVSLARSGVGHLLLVDFDVVDVTNLNRQMYLIPHLGMPKTDALRQILSQINPWLDVQTCQIRVTPENVRELFGDWPIVCEAFDRPDQKAMLTGTLLAQCPDTVIVSGNGMAGLGDANDIRTQQKMSRLYICGDGETDSAAGAGLMAPRVAVCAGHQANKVLQLILGTDNPDHDHSKG